MDDAAATVRPAPGRVGLTAIWRPTAGVAAIAFAVAGQYALLGKYQPAASLLYGAAIALLLAALGVSARGRTIAPPIANVLGSAQLSTSHLRLPLLLAGMALLAAAVSAFLLGREITSVPGGWLWGLSLACLLLAGLLTHRWPEGPGLLAGPSGEPDAEGIPRVGWRWEVALLVCILSASAALRLINIELFPGVLGDEGERSMVARELNHGRSVPLFGDAWWGVPNLYFHLVAGMLKVFGDDMLGARMLSVILGVAGVASVHWVGRMLWGPRVGLLAAALLAASPMWLQFGRQATEATPTGTLWAFGFGFLFLALRDRGWRDWVLAGLCWGLSVYFYASSKLILGLIPIVAAYCLLRWRSEFVRLYLPGFVALVVAFLITVMPYGIYAAQAGWHTFTGRAQETSIFSARNLPATFGRNGIHYEESWRDEPLGRSLLTHPVEWAQALFHQTRVSAEVLYIRGDGTGFFQTREHAGSLLPPVLAAITLLGLVYSLYRVWDARLGILQIWFWGGMLGLIFTIDTPALQRIVGAWPAVMLFPAIVLDRVAATAAPLSPSLARTWATLPMIGLALGAGASGVREYFDQYASLCPFCAETTQARYALALGQDYRAYQLGVGDGDTYFTYGSTRFVAKDVEGTDLAAPSDRLPFHDATGKGAAFIIYPNNLPYLPIVKLLYPGGAEELIKTPVGQERFTSYKLTSSQVAERRQIQATYTSASGPALLEMESRLGWPTPANRRGWPPHLTFPLAGTWQGGLIAPSYGVHTFGLVGDAAATLEIDGVTVVRTQNGEASASPVTGEVVLARGLHNVRLSADLPSALTRLEVQWGPSVGQLASVDPRFLFGGPTGGLAGEVWSLAAGSDYPPLTAPPPNETPRQRRVDGFFGFRQTVNAIGNAPFQARWRGTLNAPSDGTYTFEIRSQGPALLSVDGRAVLDKEASGGITPAVGDVFLDAGAHAVELRHAWRTGSSRLEWYWMPPGGQLEIVPPIVLDSAERAWTRAQAPGAEAARFPAGGPARRE
jgi:hypothetical protein